MLTYQDYEEHIKSGVTQADFLKQAINEYISSDLYKIACIADDYNKQKNTTINRVVRKINTLDGRETEDFTASNNKIASNIFRRLITQRVSYSLGNGISFAKEGIKEKFGKNVDNITKKAGRSALSDGVSYFYLADKLYYFKATEIVPLYDECTGSLRAAIRFWQLDTNKPMQIVFFEKNGYTKYADTKEKGVELIAEKRPYILKTIYTRAFGLEIVDGDNYPELPIVPLWGSDLKQSALIGMREAIDAIDLVKSGFANDLSDCAEIYWLLQNAGGTNDNDLRKFRDRLLLNHIAVTTSEETTVTPYTQEIPYQARKEFLQDMKSDIYEGFGGLDVHTIAAGATNDHIDAAYQPLDEEADDFEYQIIEAFEKLGVLLGLDPDDCVPIFKRNRVANYTQKVDALMQMSQYLDQRTILEKSDIITVDEVDTVMERTAAEEQAKVVDLRAELEELRARTNEAEDMTDGRSA